LTRFDVIWTQQNSRYTGDNAQLYVEIRRRDALPGT